MASLIGVARLLAGNRWGLRGGTPAVPVHV